MTFEARITLLMTSESDPTMKPCLIRIFLVFHFLFLLVSVDDKHVDDSRGDDPFYVGINHLLFLLFRSLSRVIQIFLAKSFLNCKFRTTVGMSDKLSVITVCKIYDHPIPYVFHKTKQLFCMKYLYNKQMFFHDTFRDEENRVFEVRPMHTLLYKVTMHKVERNNEKRILDHSSEKYWLVKPIIRPFDRKSVPWTPDSNNQNVKKPTSIKMIE